jgi:hypothetical protein
MEDRTVSGTRDRVLDDDARRRFPTQEKVVAGVSYREMLKEFR